MARLSFRCDDDLVEAVDAVRGQIPRERWLRDVVGGAVSVAPRIETVASAEYEFPLSRAPVPPSVPPFRGQPGPNVENVRSSSQAKRDVTPIPKGGK